MVRDEPVVSAKSFDSTKAWLEPLKTACLWAGTLAKDRPPLEPEDADYMFAEALALLMLPVVVKSGPLSKTDWKDVVKFSLVVAHHQTKPPPPESFGAEADDALGKYLRWAHHVEGCGGPVSRRLSRKCDKGIKGLCDAVPMSDPRRAMIIQRMEEFDAAYGPGIFKLDPPAKSMKAAYRAKLPRGASRTRGLSWEEAKQKLKQESGVGHLGPKGAMAAYGHLLAGIWDDDGMLVVTNDGKVQLNAGKAWDRFLSSTRTDFDRKKAGKGTVSLDADLHDQADPADDAPLENPQGAEAVRAIREIRESGLTPAEIAALEYLQGEATRKELAIKHKVTQDAIRSAKPRVVQMLRQRLVS